MKRGDFDWSPRVLAIAQHLWQEGRSARLIGEAIGCSKNALLGKAHRLGWPSRPSPITNRAAAKARKPHVIGNAPTLAPLPSTRVPTLCVMPEPEQMPARTCCWIHGAPTRRATFCGAPTQRGSSYCAEHHARCWYRPTKPSSEIGAVPMRDGRADDRGLVLSP